MVKKISKHILNFFFLLRLRVNFRKKKFSFNDLNFRQITFIDFKIIKQYVIKENFIYNTQITEIHTFNFLNLFQKVGGERGINLSKKNIFLWFKKFRYSNDFPWSGDLISKRLINIIYNFDFICSISTSKEIEKLEHIINFHIKRFIFDFKRKKFENISSFDVVILVLIKNIYNIFNLNTLETVNAIIRSHIDNIAMHKSYNILEHAKFLNNLNEIKNILLFFKNKIPKSLDHQILAMTSLLSMYRHSDYSLPLFNNSNNNYIESIEKIIEREKFLKIKSFSKFSNGIGVYKDLKKTLFFDVVQPTKNDLSKNLSAGSLSIEISALGEKIITNCGGSEAGGKNPSYLKYSAAHSTIIINNTNISEIKEGEINTNFPKQVIFEYEETNDNVILNGTHNGYLKNYKKICKRNINISKKNNLFKGEDTIINSMSNIDKTYYHVRFHLMPNISTTLTENKKNIIMRTKKNNMWMFKSDNEINIEKSIIVENNIAKETNQIVISGSSSYLKKKIKWSLEKI